MVAEDAVSEFCLGGKGGTFCGCVVEVVVVVVVADGVEIFCSFVVGTLLSFVVVVVDDGGCGLLLVDVAGAAGADAAS